MRLLPLMSLFYDKKRKRIIGRIDKDFEKNLYLIKDKEAISFLRSLSRDLSLNLYEIFNDYESYIQSKEERAKINKAGKQMKKFFVKEFGSEENFIKLALENPIRPALVEIGSLLPEEEMVLLKKIKTIEK